MKPSTAVGSVKPFVSLDLKRTSSRSGKSDRDATTALRETVEAIWKVVEQASLRASTAVAAALEVLRPRQGAGRVRRKYWWRLEMQR